MSKGKTLIIDDILFGYAIVAIPYFQGLLDLWHTVLLAFIISAFLSYVEPVDSILMKLTIYTIMRMGGKPRLIYEKAFESSLLCYSRLKLTTAIYLVIILIMMALYMTEPWIRIPAILVAVTIIAKLTLKDYKDFIYKMCATAGYLATIGSPGHPRHPEWKATMINNVRRALENGDWLEAFNMLMIMGIPGGVKIPKRIIEAIKKS